MDARDIEQDRWLSEQRTELAWSRSGLSALACVVILVRRLTDLVSSTRLQVLALALVCLVAAAAGLFALAWRGMRQRHVRVRFGAITVGATALALAGLGLALFPPG